MTAGSEFHAPPNWPPPPVNWRPPPGWKPDPAWGPPPAGWVFWGPPGKTLTQPAPQTPLSTPRRSHKVWLVIYWTATAFSLVLLALALIGDGQPIPLAGYLGVGLGAFAALSGALMATHLSWHGANGVLFDEATSGMRVISIGWLLFLAVMIGLSWTYTEPGVDGSAAPDAAVAATSELTSTLFGVAALFAVVGSGYSSYRSTMDKLSRTAINPSELRD